MPDTEGGTLRSRIATGVRAAAAEPGCRLAIVTIAITAFLISPFIALIPAVALELFDHEDTGTAILVTAQGIGAVAGALALAPIARRFGRRRALQAGFMAVAVAVVAYAGAPSLPLAAVALVIVGATYISVLSGLGTVVQLRAPRAYRARILSLYMVALGTIYPLGAIVQGVLDDRLGIRVVTAGCAVAFIGLVLAVRFLRPQLASAFDDPVDLPGGPAVASPGENEGDVLPPAPAGSAI